MKYLTIRERIITQQCEYFNSLLVYLFVETLRLYPPGVFTDSGCVKEYKVPGTDFVIRKGEAVLIPIVGLHHDEKYWKEPMKFSFHEFMKFSFLVFVFSSRF